MAKILTDAEAYKLDRANKRSRDIGLGSKLQSLGAKTKGSFTTAGGDTAESITDADVAVGDLVFVTVKTEGASPVSIVSAIAAAGSITLEMSADPSTDHILQYVVFEA